MKKDSHETIRRKYFKWLIKQDGGAVEPLKKKIIKDYTGKDKIIFYRGYGDLERYHYNSQSPYYYDARYGYKYGYPKPFSNNQYWDSFINQYHRNLQKEEEIILEKKILQNRNERRMEFLKKQRVKIVEEKSFFENFKLVEIIKHELKNQKNVKY
jgi:hypothetical protein